MEQYKTVKEVCALTGLTRKHLYYFHHQHVVQAADYANYSVEGNDGYKLYDAQSVERLRLIALYYRLGLKRNEIRDMMLSPDYDSYQVLDQLIVKEEEKQAQIRQNLAVLGYLKRSGETNGLTPALVQEALCSLAKEPAVQQK